MKAVYVIYNETSEGFYIGQSVDFYSRKKHHLNHLRRGTHANDRLQKAFNKYGEDAFTFHPVEVPASVSLDAVEQRMLERLGTHEDSYNICLTPHQPPLHSPDYSFTQRVAMLEQRIGRRLTTQELSIWQDNPHIKSTGTTVIATLSRLGREEEAQSMDIRNKWATNMTKEYGRLLRLMEKEVTLENIHTGMEAVVSNVAAFARDELKDQSKTNLLNQMLRGLKPTAYGWRLKGPTVPPDDLKQSG